MRVPRFRNMRAYALVLVALGVFTSTTVLIAAAAIPLLFTVYGAVAWTPTVDERLAAERTITPEHPVPGQPVEVEVTVTNVGDRPIPDLRMLDGVPAELGVDAGSPRGGGVLRAGNQLRLHYTVIADRGTYEFGDLSLRARNVHGSRRLDTAIEPTGSTSFTCQVTVEDVPLPQETTPRVGQLATDTGGPGIEFYGTRNYRPGDPVKRIDWNQYAKTGELITIDYREQKAAHVAVIADSRASAHVAADTTQPTGATLSAYAATRTIEVLLGEGHHVSVGALGIENPQTDLGPPAWVQSDEPTQFQAHAATVLNEAATDVDSVPRNGQIVADGGNRTERLRSLVPAGAQVMLVTPLLEEYVPTLVEQLRADGHAVTVLSPDVTPEGLSGRIVSLQRASRIEQVRLYGARVIDWSRNEELPLAISRALQYGVQG